MVKEMLYNNKLVELREANNLKQIDIAKLLDIDRSVYGKYEREYMLIPTNYLNILSNYFNVSIDYILNFSDKKNYDNVVECIDKKIVGLRLKDFRRENNLTQDKLANSINTVHSVITKCENGITLIALPFLYDICKKYKISADYLLGKVDKPKYLK